MHREELVAFLQDEADRAMLTLFPRIMGYLEAHFIPGEKTVVPVNYVNAWQENIRQTILSTAVKKLEGLGYKAHSYYNDEGNPCLEVE